MRTYEERQGILETLEDIEIREEIKRADLHWATEDLKNELMKFFPVRFLGWLNNAIKKTGSKQ